MTTLPIKWIWFSMIFRGEKLEEYRIQTAYYVSRFRNLFGCHDLNQAIADGRTAYLALRNGYRADSPTIYIKASLGIGEGRPEWGAKAGEEYFILHIHKVYTKNPAADMNLRTSRALDAAAKLLSGYGYCTHFPGYTCDKDFSTPGVCEICIREHLLDQAGKGKEAPKE